MKNRKTIKRCIAVLADILLLALLLGIFAIQHYTPTKQEPLGIVSNIPQTKHAADTEPITNEPIEDKNSEESVTSEGINYGSSNQNLILQSTADNIGNYANLVSTDTTTSDNYLVSGTGLLAQGRNRSNSTQNTTAVDISSENAVSTSAVQSYSAEGVEIQVQHLTTSDGRVEYVLADIQLSDVTLLKTAFANNTYGTGYVDTVPNMDNLLNAILTVNGDYYGNGTSGVVARNGVIYRASPTNSDILLLYASGEMLVKSYAEFDAQAEANAGLWQAWTFGPSLLDEEGNAISNFQINGHLSNRNPCTVIGYYENGHYGILVVNGRGDSEGLSLTELSALCEEIGFKVAYNLDGGKSSVMVYDDTIVNEPASGGRSISDVIYIEEGV